MRGLAAALLLLLGACAGVMGPEVAPSGRPGWSRFTVGALTFEAPDSWRASGRARAVRVDHPDGRAWLEVRTLEKTWPKESACLEEARASLAKGAPGLTNVRRHDSTFAGRKAVTQEADQGAWHGWAWAVCDGERQYRIFFTGRTPTPPDVIEAWRNLTKTATFAGAEVPRA